MPQRPCACFQFKSLPFLQGRKCSAHLQHVVLSLISNSLSGSYSVAAVSLYTCVRPHTIRIQMHHLEQKATGGALCNSGSILLIWSMVWFYYFSVSHIWYFILQYLLNICTACIKHMVHIQYIYIFCEAINQVPSVCAPLKSLAKTGTLQQGIVFRYHHGDTHPVLLSPSVLLHFAFSSNPPHLSPRRASHLLAKGYRPRSCCHFPARQCGVAAIGVQPPVPCSCSRKPDNYLSPVFRPADCLYCLYWFPYLDCLLWMFYTSSMKCKTSYYKMLFPLALNNSCCFFYLTVPFSPVAFLFRSLCLSIKTNSAEPLF